MATKVSILNSSNAYWQDRDLNTFYRDNMGVEGHGVLKPDKVVPSFLNKDFGYGNGSISADGWIGEAFFNWYADLGGSTSTISYDNSEYHSGSQSLKIECTVNNGTQTARSRIVDEAGNFSEKNVINLPDVKPNTTYRLEGFIKVDSVTNANSGGACLRVRAVNENGEFEGSEIKSQLITGTGNFALQSVEISTNSNASKLFIEVSLENETGVAWFDSLNLIEVGTHLKCVENDTPNNQIKVLDGVGYIGINKGGFDFLTRFEINGSEFVDIPSNSSGNPRIDLVVAQVDNVTEPNIDSSNIGSIIVVEGVPNVSPVAPSVPDNSIVLASVYVANGQTTFNDSDITDLRQPLFLKDISTKKTSNDLMSYEKSKEPATTNKAGTVKISTDSDDLENPVALSVNDGRVLTQQQKTDLVELLSISNLRIITAGENYTYTGVPIPLYLSTNGKVYAIDGSDKTNQDKFIGFAKESLVTDQNVTVQVSGVVSGFTGLVEGYNQYPALGGAYSGGDIDSLVPSTTINLNTYYSRVSLLADGIKGMLSNFTLRLGRGASGSGADVMVSIFKGPINLQLNTGTILSQDQVLMYTSVVSSSSLTAGLQDFIFNCDLQIMPDSQYWISVHSEYSGVNFATIQTASSGTSYQIYYLNDDSEWTASSHIYYTGTFTPDSDLSNQDVDAFCFVGGAKSLGLAISETDLLIGEFRKSYFYTGLIQDDVKDTLIKNQLEMNYVIQPGFVPVRVKFQTHYNNASYQDQEIILNDYKITNGTGAKILINATDSKQIIEYADGSAELYVTMDKNQNSLYFSFPSNYRDSTLKTIGVRGVEVYNY